MGCFEGGCFGSLVLCALVVGFGVDSVVVLRYVWVVWFAWIVGVCCSGCDLGVVD